MRILVTCGLPDSALEQLRSLAVEVVYRPDASAQTLPDLVAGVGILVVGDTRVSAQTIGRGGALQMIIHAGPGPGDIALEEASAQGIFVTHCPEQHAVAIAEHALALLLALDRQLVAHTLALHDGRWDRRPAAEARGLAGRTLGILGYDAVGRQLARRALAFDMRVLAWSPTITGTGALEPGVEPCLWPRELARRSDFVVVLPTAEEDAVTLVDADFLQNLPRGAYLVHVGRPGAVDEVALAEAVPQRQLRVALDAFANQPLADQARFRCRLCDVPGVLVGTPNVATFTDQARQALADEIVRIVRAFVVSGDVLNCLNLCDRSPATWQLVLRVRDQVGVLAGILEAIRADGINAEEVNCRVFTGAKAAWITIALDERPSAEALETIRALPDVLHLELRAVV